MVIIQKNKDPDKVIIKKCILTDKSNTKLVKNITISEQKKRTTKNSVMTCLIDPYYFLKNHKVIYVQLIF